MSDDSDASAAKRPLISSASSSSSRKVVISLGGATLLFLVSMLTVAVNGLLVICGIGIIGDKYVTADPILSSPGNMVGHIMSRTTTVGIAFVLLGAFSGPSLASLLLIMTARTRNTRGALFTLALVVPQFVAACNMASWAWFDLIVARDTYNVVERYSDMQPGGNKPDTLKQFLGVLLFSTYSLLALAGFLIIVKLLLPEVARVVLGGNVGYARGGVVATDFQPTAANFNVLGMLGLATTLMIAFGATTIFTSVWNYSAGSYFQAISSWSIFGPMFITWGSTIPIDAFHVQPIISIKVYSDCVVYFVSLGVLAILGAFGTHSPTLRRRLHARFDMSCGGAKRGAKDKETTKETTATRIALYLFPEGVTAGEALVLSVGAFLYVYWVWFWGGWGYTRIVTEVASMNDRFPNTHVAARVMGHLTTLTMSFLTFPVARNSVWESVFGVPFDRAIKYHRALGTLCWLLVTGHMVLFQIKWLREGILLANIFTIDRLQVTACVDSGLLCIANATGTFGPLSGPTAGSTPCPCIFASFTPGPDGNPVTSSALSSSVHLDNFTVPLVELGWLLLTISIIAAIWFRRKNYEAFQYTHQAVWFFYAVALSHAWSFWYYAVGGLILIAIDKVFRTVDAARVVRVKSLLSAHGITRLVLDASFLKGRSFFAGQYVWLNIPDVSPIEWHPFTVSSPPSDSLVFFSSSSAPPRVPTVSFHIRDMGEGTWTSRLADVAGRPVKNHADLQVSVDGPHGRAGNFAERDTVIMFAGGVGITPFVSICSELFARSTLPGRGSLPPQLRRVILVWAVREVDTLSAFADMIAPLIKASQGSGSGSGSGIEFSVHLYITKDGGAADPLSPFHTHCAHSGVASDDQMRGAQAAALCRSVAVSGRPLIGNIFARAIEETRAHVEGKGESFDAAAHVTAMVCGPEQLSREVSAVAFQLATDFHSEVFMF